jgi:hypothetical protein
VLIQFAWNPDYNNRLYSYQLHPLTSFSFPLVCGDEQYTLQVITYERTYEKSISFTNYRHRFPP